MTDSQAAAIAAASLTCAAVQGVPITSQTDLLGVNHGDDLNARLEAILMAWTGLYLRCLDTIEHLAQCQPPSKPPQPAAPRAANSCTNGQGDLLQMASGKLAMEIVEDSDPRANGSGLAAGAEEGKVLP